MNLLGYYESVEIWVPDPVSKEEQIARHNNDFDARFKEKQNKKFAHMASEGQIGVMPELVDIEENNFDNLKFL